jgi:hypothetical protein
MENNNLENMTHYQLEEQLMGIVLNMNRFNYNKIRYINNIRALFNEDKVKFYNKLKRDLEDVQTLIKFITEYNNLINNQNELKEIINNTNEIDFKDTFKRMRFVEIKYNEDKDALFNKFIKEYSPPQIKLYIKFYRNKELQRPPSIFYDLDTLYND